MSAPNATARPFVGATSTDTYVGVAGDQGASYPTGRGQQLQMSSRSHRPGWAERSGVAGPTSVEWLLVVAMLVVQQGAFVSLPLVMTGESLRGSVVNSFNTAAIAVSLVVICILCAPRSRQIASLASENVLSVAFLLIVLFSTIWSIHPDLTIRRGTGYVVTMLVATYLCVRFDFDDRMRALSASFAVSAIASLLVVAVFPRYGIMGPGDLAGAWRGVFPHKNLLGAVMEAAVFTELYLLVRGKGRAAGRWALLCMYLALVALSRSATSWVLVGFYLGAAGLYLLWTRHRLVAALAMLCCSLAILAGVIAFGNDPAAGLALLGKDVTLTGRTTLWGVVQEFIRERPVLGWGYHAMWQLNDPTTTLADKLTGEWGVTSSHNSFLEITLQLGVIGVALMVAVVGSAFWRALRLCRAGLRAQVLGWFCLMYFVAATLSAQVGETLGQNQVIGWVVFNVLAFSCAQALWLQSQPPVHLALHEGVSYHVRDGMTARLRRAPLKGARATS